MKFEYSRRVGRSSNDPWIREPILKINLHHKDATIKTIALVDSGANNCLFPLEFASELGIEVRDCKGVETYGIEGNPRIAYLTEVGIEIEHIGISTLQVGFIEGLPVGGLLGQVGFFDQHRIKFERDHNIFEVQPVKK